MTGVILAGGLGRRLRSITGGYPKYTLRIMDYPLIMYPINALRLFGLEKMVIVVAYRYLDIVREHVEKYLEGAIDIEYVGNPHPEGENGYSLMLAMEHVDTDKFILSVADHIYTYGVVRKLVDDYDPSIDFLVGADSAPKFINVNEATKIKADEEGRILNIGKKIVDYTHIDAGVFIVSKRAVESLSHLKNNIGLNLADLIMELARRDYNLYVSDIVGNPWTDVDTVDDVQEILYGKRRVVIEAVLQELLEDG